MTRRSLRLRRLLKGEAEPLAGWTQAEPGNRDSVRLTAKGFSSHDRNRYVADVAVHFPAQHLRACFALYPKGYEEYMRWWSLLERR